jgi:hypothetical protein
MNPPMDKDEMCDFIGRAATPLGLHYRSRLLFQCIAADLVKFLGETNAWG